MYKYLFVVSLQQLIVIKLYSFDIISFPNLL